MHQQTLPGGSICKHNNSIESEEQSGLAAAPSACTLGRMAPVAVLCGQSLQLNFLLERTTICIFDNCLNCLLEGGIVLLVRHTGTPPIGIYESQPLTVIILIGVKGNIDNSFRVERWLFTWPGIMKILPSLCGLRLVL